MYKLESPVFDMMKPYTIIDFPKCNNALVKEIPKVPQYRCHNERAIT